MKLIEKNYKITNPKIVGSTKIISITDIHSNYYLINIVKELININPSLIIISGDTIDSIDNSNNNLIFDALKYLSNSIPTFISYGNHDTVKFIEKKEVDTHNEEFFNKLKTQTNCIIINNDCEQFKNLIIRSFNLPTDSWYQIGEPKDMFIEKFNNKDSPIELLKLDTSDMDFLCRTTDNLNYYCDEDETYIVDAKGMQVGLTIAEPIDEIFSLLEKNKIAYMPLSTHYIIRDFIKNDIQK